MNPPCRRCEERDHWYRPPPYSCSNNRPIPFEETTHTIPHELTYPAYCAERATYLAQFDAQHPKELLCFACGEYHPRKQPKKKWRLDVMLGCKYIHYYAQYGCPVDEEFTQTFTHMEDGACIMYKWPTFYEVMRGFRLGTYYGDPFLLNSSTTKHQCTETRALAVENRLLLRRRTVVGLDSRPYVRKPAPELVSMDDFCPHMREQVSSEEFFGELRDAFSLIRESSHPDHVSYLHGFRFKTVRCKSCPTEVVIEFMPRSLYTGSVPKKYNKKPVIYCLTRYIDMGHMLDPKELEWRSLTTWYKRDGVEWNQLPRSARHEKESLPKEQRPTIDLTYMEPISTRFERQLNLRPGWKPFHDMPIRGQAYFDHGPWR